MSAARSLLAAALLVLLLAATASAQDWPRFRGPNGSGVSPARTVPVSWTEKDYAWKVSLPGVGHSSPVIQGGRVYVTSADEQTGKRFLLCLRAEDGQRLWQREFAGGRYGKHQDNSFASATPAVDEQRVYVCWGGPKEFLVVALDHHRDGEEVWRTDLGPYRSGHGFGSSPIVYDGLLIVSDEQDGPSLLFALDVKTGAVRWKVPRHSKASYCTPCLYQGKDQPAELVFTSYEHGISGIDPKSGRTNWAGDVFNAAHLETAIGSPVIAGDLVLGTCGWLGVRQEVVAVRPDGHGGAKEVYRIERSAPLCTTPLVKDDLLFLWSDGGIVTCADVHTGAVHWRERVAGSYYASPVCVGDHLYGVSREGDVVVLAAAKEFERLAVNALGEGSHSTPAVADGRLYLRTFGHLFCVGKKPH